MQNKHASTFETNGEIMNEQQQNNNDDAAKDLNNSSYLKFFSY
jgi:hypothetical protein